MRDIDVVFFSFNYLERKKTVGFSLLEIMSVLIIMSMLTSFSITRWQIYQQKLQLDNVSRSLMTFLMQIQFSANQLNQSYQINVSESGLLNTLVAFELDSNKLVRVFDALKQEKSIVLGSSNTNASVVFYGKRNMASAGHFSVANAFAEVRIIVSARGRIRRCVQPTVDNHQTVMGIPLC